MRNIRIGLLIAQEGSAGLWAPSGVACARLAIDEINRDRGILHRDVELVVVNAGPDAQTGARAAADAIFQHGVDGIVGMIPSYARPPIAQLTDNRVPFVYTPQYEGFAAERDVMTTGETAEELMRPALEWLHEQRGAKRFFLCGNDYVWPRFSLRMARKLIRSMGGIVTGEMFVPVGVPDYDRIIEKIKATRSDAVLPYFLGSDSITFNRAFCAAGLSSRVLRFSSAIDETIVYGLDEDETENMLVSSGYFSSIRSSNNGAFLERYHMALGESPPPVNAFGQSCYEGIYSLAAMVQEAGSFDIRELKRYFGRIPQPRTARGAEARPAVGSRHPVHLAEIDGYDFRILNTRGFF